MFQKGEHKVFRIATGITPQGDCTQYAQMDAPAEWHDDVLCELFAASISIEPNVSKNLISLPVVEEEQQRTFAVDLGGKAAPSHDAIYGAWTQCATATSTTAASTKNVLLASSSDDEKNNMKQDHTVGTG